MAPSSTWSSFRTRSPSRHWAISHPDTRPTSKSICSRATSRGCLPATLAPYRLLGTSACSKSSNRRALFEEPAGLGFTRGQGRVSFGEIPLMPHRLDIDPDLRTRVNTAIDAVRAGKMVILVDDADRENEGDLKMAADRVTPEA